MIHVAFLLIPWLAPPLEKIARVEIPAAEIVTYDFDTNCLFVSSRSTIQVLHLGRGDDPVIIRTIDVKAALGHAGEISHVTRDPAGRGVLAACFIPEANTAEIGWVGFLSVRSGRGSSIDLSGQEARNGGRGEPRPPSFGNPGELG